MYPQNSLGYYALKFGFWAGTMVAPVAPILWTMVFLIVVDFITGVVAAIKKKQQVQSRKFFNTISKFFIYNLVILSAHFIGLHVIPDLPMLKIVGGFIAITELKSIFENFSKIYGINIWEYVKEAISRKGGNPPD